MRSVETVLAQDVALADTAAAASIGSQLAVEDEINLGIRAWQRSGLGDAGKGDDNGSDGRQDE